MVTPVDASLVATIAGWMPPPQGYLQLIARFGAIQVRDKAIITPGWESAHMMMAKADWLPTGRLYVNKGVWEPLQSAFVACLALGDGYEIRTMGCFAPRCKRVNGDLSTHSWGIAIDLNEDTNPLQAPGGPVITDIPPTWIAEFQKRGFTSGLDFSGRKDPMHLQYVEGY